VTNTWGVTVRTFFLPTPHRISFLASTDRIRLQIFFLPYLERLRAINTRCHALSHPSHLLVATVVFESSVTTSVSPSRCHSEPRVSFGPSSASFSREVSSSCSALPPRVFLSLNRARERGYARSGHGVAVFARRRRFFLAVAASSNRGPSDLGSTVQIRSYRFVAILLKSPSLFLETNPWSMAYS
jgi:hypothetical protein